MNGHNFRQWEWIYRIVLISSAVKAPPDSSTRFIYLLSEQHPPLTSISQWIPRRAGRLCVPRSDLRSAPRRAAPHTRHEASWCRGMSSKSSSLIFPGRAFSSRARRGLRGPTRDPASRIVSIGEHHTAKKWNRWKQASTTPRDQQLIRLIKSVLCLPWGRMTADFPLRCDVCASGRECSETCN